MRPTLIISSDIFNHGPGGLVTVVPITTRSRPLHSYLPITPPDGGLTQQSFIICHQARTIATERLGKRLGILSPQLLAQVGRRLRILLDL